VDIDQIADEVCSVETGTVCGDRDMAATGKSFIPQEEVGGPMPLILVVLPRRCSGTERQPKTSVSQQLLGNLVEVDPRIARIMGTGVDVEDVFHALLDTALSDPCHRRDAQLDGFGNHDIGAAWSLRSFIRFEQDTGMGKGPGRSVATRYSLAQQETLGFGEGDPIHLDPGRRLQVGMTEAYLSSRRCNSSMTDR
jgi:hypothetical protein